MALLNELKGILERDGLYVSGKFEEWVDLARTTHQPLDRVLVTAGYLTEAQMLKVFGECLRMPVLGRDFQRGIAKLREHDLTYDLLIYPHQLPAAIRLAEAFPEQAFVLDHLAKPRVKDGLLEPWKTQLRRLARLPNVHCKVSGMITEADHRAWRAEQFLPYLDTVFEAFGPARLMYGSDWPVCLLAGDYRQAFELVDDYARQCAPAEREALFGANCAAFYFGA